MGLSAREIAMLLSIKAQGGSQAAGQVNQVNQAIQHTALLSNSASMKMFGYSNVFAQTGRSMTMAGMAMTGAGIAAGKLAISFDEAMRLVHTQTQLSEDDFRDLEEQVIQLGSKSAHSLEELSQGLYDVFSTTDLNSKQAINALDLFQKAATAGGTDIRTTARAAIGEMNAFGMSASDLTTILDQQFQLVKLGGGTYEEFASTLGLGVSSAVAAGQSIDSFNSMLEFLTRNGMSAAEAVTAASRAMDLMTRTDIVKKMRDELGVAVKDASGSFREMNDIIYDMATKGGMAKLSEFARKKTLESIFGQGEIRANRFFNTAIPRFKELDDLMTQTTDYSGAMEKAFEKMGKSPSVQLKTLINSIKAIATGIVMGMIPAIQDTLKLLAKWVDWFNGLSDETKSLIGKLVFFGGILLLVAGRLNTVASVGMMMISMMQLSGITMKAAILTVTAVNVAIFALGAAIIYLATHWDQVTAWWKKNWGTIKAVALASIPIIIVLLQALWANMMSGKLFYPIVSNLMVAFDKLKLAVAGNITPSQMLKGVWQQMKGVVLVVAIYAFVKAMEHMNNVMHGNEQKAQEMADAVSNGSKSMADLQKETDAATQDLSLWERIMHKDTEAMNTFALAQEKIRTNFEKLVNTKMGGTSAQSMFVGTDDQLAQLKELQAIQKEFDALADMGAKGAESAYQRVTDAIIELKEEMYTIPFEQFADATGKFEGSVSALNGVRSTLMNIVTATDEAKLSFLGLTNQLANMQGGFSPVNDEVTQMYLRANNLAGAEEYLREKIDSVSASFEKQIDAILRNKNANKLWSDTVAQAAMSNRTMGMEVGEMINKIYASGEAIRGADSEILKAAIDTGNWGRAFEILNAHMVLSNGQIQEFTKQILTNATAYENWKTDVVQWTHASRNSSEAVKRNVGALAANINKIHELGIKMGRNNAEYIRSRTAIGKFGDANARAAHILASGLIKNLDKAVKSTKNLSDTDRAAISNAQKKAAALIDQANGMKDAEQRTKLYERAIKLLDTAQQRLPKTKTINLTADTSKAITNINNLDRQLQLFVQKDWKSYVDVYYRKHGEPNGPGNQGFWTHRNYGPLQTGQPRTPAALAGRGAGGGGITVNINPAKEVVNADDVRRELEWAHKTRGW